MENERISTVSQVLGLLLVLATRGGSAWAAVPETWPGVGETPGVESEVRMGVQLDADLVPAFRTGSRDRRRLWVRGRWTPESRIALTVRGEGMSDLHPDGTCNTGPGDLELGARLALMRGAPAATGGQTGPEIWAGWWAKMPNAADGGELGTDETDIGLYGLARFRGRGWSVGTALGLAVLGNPLRFAAQDDVPHGSLELTWTGPSSGSAWVPGARLVGSWALETARNPARAEAGGELWWGERWLGGGSLSAGLTPASPTVRAGIWGGYAWGARDE